MIRGVFSANGILDHDCFPQTGIVPFYTRRSRYWSLMWAIGNKPSRSRCFLSSLAISCVILVFLLLRTPLQGSNTFFIVSVNNANGRQVLHIAKSDWSSLDITIANLSKQWEEYESSFAVVTSSQRPKSRQQIRNELCHAKGRTFLHQRQWTHTECNRIAHGDALEIRRYHKNNPDLGLSDEEFIGNMTNCSKLLDYFQTTQPYSSLEEKEFPLAFVLIFAYGSKLIQQYMRQLKLLYQPQNVYCIHIDRKAPDWWIKGIQMMTKCFPNVVYVEDPVKVWFRHWSLLEAQLRCYSVLLELETPLWEYGMAVRGVELPLATNREMVNYLRVQNNKAVLPKVQKASDIFAKQVIVDQATMKTKLYSGIALLTDVELTKPPNGVKMYRSFDESVGVALPRAFIEFMLSDDRALDLREYLKNVQAAEDFFYQTVNQFTSPSPPGHVIVRSKTPPIIYHDIDDDCIVGNYIKYDNCTVGVKKLQKVLSLSDRKGHFFYHKYLHYLGNVVVGCMEERMRWKNQNEFMSDCGKILLANSN